jgi:hypothetical protein
MTGRPTDFTDELAREILDAIANTTIPLKTLCESNSCWPNQFTVNRWRSSKPEFSDLYDRAQAKRAHLHAEEVIAIADNADNDYTYDQDGNQIANTEHIARTKLRMEARKWIASKLANKMYGDKMQQETTINVIPYGTQLKELE